MKVEKEIAKRSKNYNKTIKEIENKKYIYQFIPNFLYNIKNTKKIKFTDNRGKLFKLNTEYIIDLVNTGIINCLFRKDNAFILNAGVMKKRYGKFYNKYVEYLIAKNIIYMSKGHLKGRHSRTYSFRQNIANNNLKRYKNRNKCLLKKYIERCVDVYKGKADNNGIEIYIKQKMVDNLLEVNIDINKTLYFLKNIKNDQQSYNKNIKAVESIYNRDIFFKFDNYGRMHTNYTVLQSYIRKNYLDIKGEKLNEIDISNSQPLFLAKIIQETNSSIVDKEEFELFKRLVKNGEYYSHMMKKLKIDNRKYIKKSTYKVLFGENKIYEKEENNKKNFNTAFRKIFPTIFAFITKYKRNYNNYKCLSYKLQKMESELIFNKIIKRVLNKNPDIIMITVHDSIIVQKSNYNIVNDIFNEELEKEFDF